MPAATSIDVLPDDLLGRIFQLVRQGEDLPWEDEFNAYDQPEPLEQSSEQHAALPAVCWRWCSVYWSSPLLWRQLDLFPNLEHLHERLLQHDSTFTRHTVRVGEAEQWLHHRCRVLEWVGHLVRRLTVASACVPDELREYGDAALAEALRQCTRLEELSLRWPSWEFTAAAGGSSGGYTLLGTAGYALRQLSTLTALTLNFEGARAVPLQNALSKLSQLRCLDLLGLTPSALVAGAPKLALLTGLRHLQLTMDWRHTDSHLPLASILAGMSALDSLAVTATVSADDLRALQRLGGLTSLTLRFGGQLGRDTAEELRATLQHLPHMADLALRANELPGPVLGCITALTHLTHLDLSASKSSLPPPLRQLTVLTALRTLHLDAAWTDGLGAEPWPAPASFPLLRQYGYHRAGVFQLSDTGVTLQLAEYDCFEPCMLQLNVGSWASLHQTLAAVMPAGGPAAVHAFRAAQEKGAALTAALQGCNQLSAVQRMSLEFSTVSLDPAALPALRALRLSCGSVSITASSSSGTGTFPHLTSLSIESDIQCESSGSLQALLRAAPSLASLWLREGAAASCLPGLAIYGGPLVLRYLQLQPGPTSAPLCLPPGPYLSCLEALELQYCGLSHVPEALAAATRLCRLDLSNNPALAITCADVDAVLRHLSRLARLRLDSLGPCPTPSMSPQVAAHLLKALPLLQPPCS